MLSAKEAVFLMEKILTWSRPIQVRLWSCLFVLTEMTVRQQKIYKISKNKAAKKTFFTQNQGALIQKRFMPPFLLTVFFPWCFAVNNKFTAIPVNNYIILNCCRNVFFLPECLAVNCRLTAIDVNNAILLNCCKIEISLPECIAVYSIILSDTNTV